MVTILTNYLGPETLWARLEQLAFFKGDPWEFLKYCATMDQSLPLTTRDKEKIKDRWSNLYSSLTHYYRDRQAWSLKQGKKQQQKLCSTSWTTLHYTGHPPSPRCTSLLWNGIHMHMCTCTKGLYWKLRLIYSVSRSSSPASVWKDDKWPVLL